MKRINLNNDQEIFDSFKEENIIALMESILISLEIISDRCSKLSILDNNNNNHMNLLIQDAELQFLLKA